MGKHNIITLFLTSFDRVEKELILHAWNILSPSYSLEFIYWKKKLILTILPLSIIVVLKVSLYHMIINIQGCRSLNFFLSFSISNLLTKLTLTILVNNRRKKKLEYHFELHEMAGDWEWNFTPKKGWNTGPSCIKVR